MAFNFQNVLNPSYITSPWINFLFTVPATHFLQTEEKFEIALSLLDGTIRLENLSDTLSSGNFSLQPLRPLIATFKGYFFEGEVVIPSWQLFNKFNFCRKRTGLFTDRRSSCKFGVINIKEIFLSSSTFVRTLFIIENGTNAYRFLLNHLHCDILGRRLVPINNLLRFDSTVVKQIGLSLTGLISNNLFWKPGDTASISNNYFGFSTPSPPR